MIGQVQVLELTDLATATTRLMAAEAELLAAANQHHPTIQKNWAGELNRLNAGLCPIHPPAQC
jgi:hypothetical protein